MEQTARIIDTIERDVARLSALSMPIRKALRDGNLDEVENGLRARDHLVSGLTRSVNRLVEMWVEDGPEPDERRKATECVDRLRALAAEGDEIREALAVRTRSTQDLDDETMDATSVARRRA